VQLEEDRLAAIAKAKRDAEEAEARRIQAIKDAERAEIEAYLEAYRELHRIRGMHFPVSYSSWSGRSIVGIEHVEEFHVCVGFVRFFLK
jgi:hypothetical protein